MANQYKSALQHAADDFKKEIELYGIEILPYEIRWQNQALEILSGTDKQKCRQEIKKMIELAVEATYPQGSLL